MPTPRWRRVSVHIFLAVLVGCLATIGGSTTSAVQAQASPPAQVVPECDPTLTTCHIYEYDEDWVVSPATTMAGAGGFFALTYQVLPETSFQYFETPWVSNHVPDNESLVQGFALAILSQAGQAPTQPVATGSLADGTLWQLYAVTVAETTYGMLFTGDTADPSQNDVTTILTSPAPTFDQALAAVQSGIRVDGVSPLAGIDPAQAMTALAEGVAPPPVATALPTADPSPTEPPISTTPANPLDQSVPAGTDTVTYSSDWQLDTANSSTDVVTFQSVLDPSVIFGYAQGADRESGGDAQIALDILDAPTAFGGQNAQLVSSETLPSGHAFALYTWEREGVSEVALFVVDVGTTPGTLRLQFLFAPPPQFAASLSSAQQDFQINGVSAFGELDPAALAALLSGGAAVTATPAGVSTAGPTPTSGSNGFTEAPRGRLTPLAATTPVQATTSAPVTGNEPVVVAGATIAYGGTWVYDTVNSAPDQFAFFDNDALTWGFFGYRTIPDTTGGLQVALRTFDEAYIASLGATNPRLIREETLPGGQAWALYTLEVGGQSVVLLTYAQGPGSAGQASLQWLFTGSTEFEATLTDAEANLQIDGVPAFSELDPTTVSALLGG